MVSNSGTVDVIVVLGAALTADGSAAPALRARLATAAQGFAEGLAPRVIVTGAGECAVMGRELVALGVPESAITFEPRATSTRENALETAAVMRLQRLRRALVVTQPYHMRRALGCFAQAGILAEGLPADSLSPSLTARARELGARALYRLLRWT